QVFALRATDGTVLWEAQFGARPGPPVVLFDPDLLPLVAVAEQEGVGPGFLRAFDANSGADLWTSSDPVSQAGQSCTDPIIIPHFETGGRLIQVGTFDGRLMSFLPRSGGLAWERQLGPDPLFARPHWANL